MKVFKVIGFLSVLALFVSCGDSGDGSTDVISDTTNASKIANVLSVSVSSSSLDADETPPAGYTEGQVITGSCYNGQGTYSMTVVTFEMMQHVVFETTYDNCVMMIPFCEGQTVTKTGTITEENFLDAEAGQFSSSFTGNMSFAGMVEGTCEIAATVSGTASSGGGEMPTLTFTGTICGYTFDELKDFMQQRDLICQAN